MTGVVILPLLYMEPLTVGLGLGWVQAVQSDLLTRGRAGAAALGPNLWSTMLTALPAAAHLPSTVCVGWTAAGPY